MTYGVFDYERDVEGRKPGRKVPPKTHRMPEVSIPVPGNYNGMLPNINRDRRGNILPSHIGPGGFHGDRKY
jgi:hypothetical protein